MSNNSVAFARFRMSACDALPMTATGATPAALVAVVTGYVQLIADARNGAQGRTCAWSPPV